MDTLKLNSRPLNYNTIYEAISRARDQHYILLGESTHGTDEYYLIRLIMTIIMVQDFGFRTIMFETEWSLGYQLNLYIHSIIDGDIQHLLNKLFVKYPKWMCNNDYIMHLVLFLKKWNKTHGDDKVYFYGIDCQDIEIANKNVCHDNTVNCRIVKQIVNNYSKMKSSGNYWNMRDTFWFNIIKQLELDNNHKFVLWAHNSHIGNVRANLHNTNKINIGYLLDSAYGSYKIGFSTFKGTVKASKEWGGIGRKYSLKPAIEGSYEHMFHLITKEIDKKEFGLVYYSNPLTPIQKQIRYVGVIYNSDNEMVAHYNKTNINQEFNVVIFVDTTNYLKSLTPNTIQHRDILKFYIKKFNLISKYI